MESVGCAEICPRCDPCSYIPSSSAECCFRVFSCIPTIGEASTIYWTIRCYISTLRISSNRFGYLNWTRQLNDSLSWITVSSIFRSVVWFIFYYFGRRYSIFDLNQYSKSTLEQMNIDVRIIIFMTGMAASPILLTHISRRILKNKIFCWRHNQAEQIALRFDENVIAAIEHLISSFIPILPILQHLYLSELRKDWFRDHSLRRMSYHTTPLPSSRKDSVLVEQIQDSAITALGQSAFLATWITVYNPFNRDFSTYSTENANDLLIIIPIITCIFIAYLGYGITKNVRSHRNYVRNGVNPDSIV